MILLICLTTLLACANAERDWDDMCKWCDFHIASVCYLEGPDCRHFYQCVRQASGWVDKEIHCCPNRTGWNQEIKNCDWDHDCDVDLDDCENVTPPDGNCTLMADEDNPAWYWTLPTWHHLMCPAGTVFDEEVCACVHGYGYKCYKDPLLHFPFANDFNDIQCPKAAGLAHGDAHIPPWKGYMWLDGDGDFMTFSFLNNWFVRNSPTHFTVSMWIKQDPAGFWDGPEGLFTNGNCHEDQTFWLFTNDQTAAGGLLTDINFPPFWSMVWFTTPDGDRNYAPPGVWCQVAMRFDGQRRKVTYFLNGVAVDMIDDVRGTLKGTMQDASVGRFYWTDENGDCKPFDFTGCIDDVMVFDRFVSDWEMYDCVWGNGRTEGHSEAMYKCPPKFIPTK